MNKSSRGMKRSTFKVSNVDGIQVCFDLYQDQGRDAIVIICPGFFQSKETLTFQRLASALSGYCNVVCMDFRGHGRSGGLYTFSARESADLERVLNWTASRYKRIGILGFSLGAAIAITTLRRCRYPIQSLVAVSAPCSFEEIEFKWWTPEAMRTGIQGMEPGAGCRPGNLFLKKERPIDYVQKLAPIPVLFIHGTNDMIIGVRHSRRLYAAASEPKRLEIIEGGSHAEALFRDAPNRFCNLLKGWFAETLLPDTMSPGQG